jgi:hypothetical protein
LISLVTRIATRFEIVVSEKVLLQTVPLVGAVTGAAINAGFTEHFNTIARFHFGIRRLERRLGQQRVQEAYLAQLESLRTETP